MVQQNPNAGPSTVVNIGQVNIVTGPVTPNREPIIEAEAIRPELPENLAESLVVEGKR